MIRERMLVEPAHLPRFPYGRFNSSYLRQDLQAIRNLYASNGFRDVAVTSRVEDDFHGGTNHLGVFIEIVEGHQWLVNDVKLEGVRRRRQGKNRRFAFIREESSLQRCQYFAGS